ncbi:pentapeptide repeat-containing protein [Chryseobacterium sp. CH1]|uniref:pentapeptide repeat-containing protein n=1 Tax=Chryseobacterium sp. CH1 TaxID=713551 RepID=UPI0039775D46
MKKTVFKNSKLIEVDFAECDLSNAVFSNCLDFSLMTVIHSAFRSSLKEVL